MVCKFCGSEFDDSLRACPVCNSPSAAPAQPVYQQQTYQQPAQPVYQQQTYQQPTQPVYQQQTYQQPAQPVYQQQTYQQPAQHVYQQQTYQQPAQPVYQQQAYQQSYAQPGMSSAASPVDQFINEAGTIQTMSICALVFSFLCGIVGLVLLILSGSKIKNLPFVQPETLDPTKAFAYQEAQKKVQTAKTLNIIAIVVFVVSFVIGFISGFASAI